MTNVQFVIMAIKIKSATFARHKLIVIIITEPYEEI